MIQLDAGHYLQDRGLAVETVNALMIESMRRFPLRVFHLGFGDLFHWEAIRKAKLKTEVISTNLVPLDGAEGPKPYAVVEVEPSSGRPVRIAFVGLTTPQRVKERSGFRALDPLEAYAARREELLRESDFVVVLTDLRRMGQEFASDDEVRRLAEAYPEIKAIVMAEKRFVLYEPERLGDAVVISTVDRGRYLSRLTLVLDGAGNVVESQAEAIQLGPDIDEDGYWLERQAAVSAAVGGQ